MVSNKKLISHVCCWSSEEIELPETKEQYLIARADMANTVSNDIENHCAACINREQFGFAESARIKANRKIPDDANFNDFYHLELQVDNTCNAACIICSPACSSLWGTLTPDPVHSYDKNYISDAYKRIIETHDLSKLQSVSLLGGEPLLSKNNFKLLNKIPYPENVQINITTNGSIFPRDKLELLSRFKRVHVKFSIDGIGNKFEYIRWPLKWNNVKDNIYRFVDASLTTNTNFDMAFNYTANPLNVFYYDEFENWYNTSFRECNGPLLGTVHTPGVIRESVYKKYGSNHIISKLLTAHPYEGHDTVFDQLLLEMTKLDADRNTSVYDTFSDVLKLTGHI